MHSTLNTLSHKRSMTFFKSIYPKKIGVTIEEMYMSSGSKPKLVHVRDTLWLKTWAYGATSYLYTIRRTITSANTKHVLLAKYRNSILQPQRKVANIILIKNKKNTEIHTHPKNYFYCITTNSNSNKTLPSCQWTKISSGNAYSMVPTLNWHGTQLVATFAMLKFQHFVHCFTKTRLNLISICVARKTMAPITVDVIGTTNREY